jgi:hypothetical protein
MVRNSLRPNLRRPRLVAAIASVVAAAIFVTLAAISTGYDVQEVPPLASSVWVVRDSGQYARVNTVLNQIDTVRTVEDPSGVVQYGDSSIVYTQSNRTLWPVDVANPANLLATAQPGAAQPGAAQPGAAQPGSTQNVPISGRNASASAQKSTPAGSRLVVSSGNHVAYLTDTGKVFVSTINDVPASPRQLFPLAASSGSSAGTRDYVASVVGISPAGDVAVYSTADGMMRQYNAASRSFRESPVALSSPPTKAVGLELSIISGSWVLSDPSEHRVWISGRATPIATGLAAGARLQSSSDSTLDGVFLADSKLLVSIDLQSGAVQREATSAGTPAAPIVVGQTLYAAWLSATSGALYSSATKKTMPLSVEGEALVTAQAINPVLATNGTRAVLSERSSGMLWSVPDGKFIPVSQWALDTVKQNAGVIEATDVVIEKPPVAVSDSFGVRRGQLVQLPLLLNDHDPNLKDVLTVEPGSLAAGLSSVGQSAGGQSAGGQSAGVQSAAAFGDLRLVGNDQQAAIRVRAESGSATFSYAVTDGMLTSSPATVTLTVIGDATNSAPVWCGVPSCVQKWPAPEIAPGGTIRVPVLSGWVDPEGDAFVLADARKLNPADPVTVVPEPDGSVAIRHLDANGPDSTISIVISVSDAGGKTQTKTLQVSVTRDPALVVSPIAVLARANEKTKIAAFGHVSGGSGSFRLVDASGSTATSSLLAVPNAAAGTIDITATSAGSYSVNYTVQDIKTHVEQSAVIRFTVAASASPLAMAPITAFVRPHEDTTVDVLSAVQNTTGRVLIVSSAVSSSPALSISVVGQSAVRVSGSTANNQAGTVGTATIIVTDGGGATTEGSLTVFLVPASTGVGPIAVADAVTVRSGSQVDVPVTANDVSPRGERLVLHPTVKGSGVAGELVFASGSTVRYLAPRAAGVYTIYYSVYLDSEPGRLDSTSVTITVLPAEGNRAPQPPAISARVQSGQTVVIPVISYGLDPDGDTVVLDSVTQPRAGLGSVSITADGSSVEYSAPLDAKLGRSANAGAGDGQVSFTYTLRDTPGLKASGDIRVGVLDAKLADSAPVTYSDYVRVQQNSSAAVTITPLLNDTDPSAGELSLVSLVPNAPNVAGNAEYARVKALILPSTNLAKGIVSLKAGSVLGTQSFVYTAVSSLTSSTSQGLIVMTVAAVSSADRPQVADTVLTAENRNRLVAGVDVVTGSVSWTSGDTSSLSLALWGNGTAGYSVKGRTIVGTAPLAGDLVPFSLSGEDAAGVAVVSFGFLRIPAFDDMKLQLKSDLKAVSVGETESAEFALTDMISMDSGDTSEVRQDNSFAVQRANATCSPKGSTRVIYNAGREAPWVDSCTVPVRLGGQHAWTFLVVPVAVTPRDPAPQLSSLSRTIAPGASESIDLFQTMTSWQGGRTGDRALLDYTTVVSGSAFTVVQTASTIVVEARVDAVPGTKDTVAVAVSHFGGLSASITLVVGVAPVDAPRGATFTQPCDVSKARNCSVTVVDRAGEYDPFRGKAGAGLRLVSIGNSTSSVSCAAAAIVLSGTNQITASWQGAKPIGGECVVPFTVKDAQNRLGSGQLTIDVLGYPQVPLSVTTERYTGSTVTLSVPLGEGSGAHPLVTAVTLFENGKRVNADCSPSMPAIYSCVISGLKNGAKHTYTARSVNSVGESADTTELTTWAYLAPIVSDLKAAPAYAASTTTIGVAVIRLSITADDDAQSFLIVNNNQTIARTGDVTRADITSAPGVQTIQVVPISQFQPPIGSAGVNGAAIIQSVVAAGSPSFNGDIRAAASSNSAIAVSGLSLELNSSIRPPTFTYVAWQGTAPECAATAEGGLIISGGIQSDSATVAGLEPYENYSVKACASNGFGITESATVHVFTGTAVDAPPSDITYSIATTPTVDGGSYAYSLSAPPSVPSKPNFRTVYVIDGNKITSFAVDPRTTPSVKAQYCSLVNTSFCSDESTIRAKTAPTVVTVNMPTAACVTNPHASDIQVSAAASGSAALAATVSEDGLTVSYSVVWGAAFASLDAISDYTRPICAPAPGPEGTIPNDDNP